MPAQLLVSADPTGLQPAPYSGNVVISAPGANPATVKVAVTFTVAAAQPAQLCTSLPGLSFAFAPGVGAQTLTLGIQNSGSGPGNYSIATCGAPWLSVSPAQGTVAPNSPVNVSVTADPSQLSSGTTICNLTITGGGYCSNPPTSSIPVSAAVTTGTSKLQLTESGISFPAIAGGGPPLPRSFGVMNAGQGTMAWTTVVSTTAGGSWLSISPAAGTVQTPLTQVSPIGVSVNPAGLAANTYYGTVTVNAAGNPPEAVTIVLNVHAPGTAPAVDVYPAGLVFTGTQGSNNPSSQTVQIANLSTGSLNFTSSGLPAAGDSPWFVVAPTGASIAPGQSIGMVVQPNFSALSPGVHQGTVALRFSDGSTVSVAVQSVVQAAPVSDASGAPVPEASSCGLTNTALQQPWAVTLGNPTSIQIQVTETCGKTLNGSNTQVKAIFPVGTAPQTLILNPSSTPGVWENNWTPTALPSSGNLSVLVNSLYAVSNANEQQAQPLFNAMVAPPPSSGRAPVIATGGVLNAASSALGVPLAPCSLVSIYGTNLANGSAAQEVPPLQTTLAGTQLQWSGQPLYLLAATTGQINAQVPCELSVNTQLQIAVNLSGALSVPTQLPMAAYSPAIFTADQTGQGQGSILDYGPTGLAAPVILTSPPNPTVAAHAGDILAIFCTGLGAVNPAVPTGQPAGSSPPSSTTATPTVSIGGINAPVLFSGMAPGFAGLYQVNVTVPSGITPGTQVPIVLSIGGLSSSPYQNVTLAIQ